MFWSEVYLNDFIFWSWKIVVEEKSRYVDIEIWSEVVILSVTHLGLQYEHWCIMYINSLFHHKIRLLSANVCPRSFSHHMSGFNLHACMSLVCPSYMLSRAKATEGSERWQLSCVYGLEVNSQWVVELPLLWTHFYTNDYTLDFISFKIISQKVINLVVARPRTLKNTDKLMFFNRELW